jgi:hypothetical protein
VQRILGNGVTDGRPPLVQQFYDTVGYSKQTPAGKKGKGRPYLRTGLPVGTAIAANHGQLAHQGVKMTAVRSPTFIHDECEKRQRQWWR